MGLSDFLETDETVKKPAKVYVKPDPNQKGVNADDLLKKNIINNKNWICGSLR